MNWKNIFGVTLTLLIVGCSNDDNIIKEPDEILAASFEVIGEDTEAVFQYTFDAKTNTSELLNLTSEIGVPTDYLTLRQTDDFLSFYSFRQGAFSLVIKNISTGATASFVDFYANGPGRSVVWGTNTLTNVFFGYFAPGDSREIGLQDVEIQNQTSLDVSIDIDIDLLFQPLLFNDKVYITFLDNQGEYKLSFYDTLTKSLGNIINFGDTPISIFIDDLDNLVVIKNGIDATLELYDTNDLSFIRSSNLGFNSGFASGPVSGTVLSENKLYYARPYIQPARFASGPAIFDLETQESFIPDFITIADEIEAGIGSNITITAQTYSSSRNMFFIGYSILTTPNQGGVLQISPAGELIDNTSLPFFPSYIVSD